MNMVTHYQVLKTTEFENWLKSLPIKLQLRIEARLDGITENNLGDHKRFSGLIEFRWRNGTRMYGFIHNYKLIILLYGGNKNGQKKDIKKAKRLKEIYVQKL